MQMDDLRASGRATIVILICKNDAGPGTVEVAHQAFSQYIARQRAHWPK
jgi:hypothetical protein